MRRRLAIAAIVVVSLAVPATAFAWSVNYYSGWLIQNQSESSAYNSSIDFNEIRWYKAPGDNTSENVGLTLCANDSSSSCYTYMFSNIPGTVIDLRSISYGRAVCHGYAYNTYSVYCHANN
jgi:hypothetical protein